MEISISKQDLVNCYRLYSVPEKKHLLIIGALSLCFAVYVVATKSNPAFLLIGGIAGGVLGVLIHRYGYLTYKSNKIYSQQKDLHNPIKMELSEEGVTTITENGNSLSPWGNFCKYKQNSGYILLFYSDALFLMLPKNQIPSSEMSLLNGKLRSIGS
jgi:hypothetical protein